MGTTPKLSRTRITRGRSRNLFGIARQARALLRITRLFRGSIRVDPEMTPCQRVSPDQSRSSVRPAASVRPRRARARRARHTKSALSSCCRRRPVLCTGHRDPRGARRNGLMVMIGVVMAGDARHISRRRYFLLVVQEISTGLLGNIF